MTAHYTGDNSQGLVYHNSPANPYTDMSPELSLVRFTYAIFQRPEISKFLGRHDEAHVRLQFNLDSSSELDVILDWNKYPSLHQDRSMTAISWSEESRLSSDPELKTHD